MEVECEVQIGSEQREWPEGSPVELLKRPQARRGRPFVKGQSGNPAGRPREAHPTAAVAEYLIGRKTIPLTKN